MTQRLPYRRAARHVERASVGEREVDLVGHGPLFSEGRRPLHLLKGLADSERSAQKPARVDHRWIPTPDDSVVELTSPSDRPVSCAQLAHYLSALQGAALKMALPTVPSPTSPDWLYEPLRSVPPTTRS